MIETISRQEWLDRNPVLRKYIASDPIGWQTVPAFNLWPDASEIDGITEHQREQLSKATSGRIGILGGSPGTGKSFCVAKLIRHMLDRGLIAAQDIAVAAPTGKASVRVTELMQSPENNIPLRAKTWHSLLGIGANSETGGWSFGHNESSPWPYRLLIGDESSMMDLSLMLAVMRARQVGCHVLFVGDVNQLPPVGAGAPLRDMIAAGLPYGELREIKRNSGGIVEACAAIRDSLPWLDLTRADNSNLILSEINDQESKVGKIKDLLFRCEAEGLDPVWECQVLVAVNDASPLSRKLLNLDLQAELNPSPKMPGTIFRVGDKAVCLKNGWYRLASQVEDEEDVRRNDRDEVYVANGELAKVIAVDDRSVTFRMDSPVREVAVPMFRQPENESADESSESKGALANWDLGYALSVHKSQGSEWPVAIVALDAYPGARMVCDRAWLYTAISRAKRVCHLVGPAELAERFCKVQKISTRKTLLKEQIQRIQFLREVEDL